jgi:hypothetical protein
MHVIDKIQELFLNNDEKFVEGLYKELLEETPDLKVLNYFKKFLQHGGTRHEVINTIILTNDFETKVTKENTILDFLKFLAAKDGYSFINEVYNELLCENLSLADLQVKFNQLKSLDSKEKLIIDIILDDKFLNKVRNIKSKKNKKNSTVIQNKLWETMVLGNHIFINNLFSQLLSRLPSKSEISSYNEMLKFEAYKAIIKSEEFHKNLKASKSCLETFKQLFIKEDEEFVANTYSECFGRQADLDGLIHHTKLIREGASKLDILRVILSSDEANERFNKFVVKKDINKGEDHINSKPSREFRSFVQKIIVENKFSFETNLVVKTGGIGDFLQMTPVARALKEKTPTVPVVAIVGYAADMFISHPYIDKAIECSGRLLPDIVKSVIGLTENVFDLRYVSRAYGSFKLTDYFIKNKWYYDNFPYSGTRIDDLNMNVCDIMLHSLGLQKYATSNDVLVTPEDVKEKIPGKYAVVCDTAGSGPGQMKRWTSKQWDGLINWLVNENIIPIQLGKASDALLHPFVMDLRGKTTLRQSAGYLKDALFYVGLEGGVYHLAKASRTPCIVIFASTSEVCFSYSDTIVMSKKLCRPCWWTESWLKEKCLKQCEQ